MGRERLGPRGDLLGRSAHDAEVDIASLNQCQQLLAVADHAQPHIDAGMLFVESGEELGHEIFRRADDADSQQSVL